MVLNVCVITKMLSMPIPRRRKGITGNRVDYAVLPFIHEKKRQMQMIQVYGADGGDNYYDFLEWSCFNYDENVL